MDALDLMKNSFLDELEQIAVKEAAHPLHKALARDLALTGSGALAGGVLGYQVGAAGKKKEAADLTPSARTELPKKDFAVSAKASNTGKPAYPIEDRQHAISALGFSKMHGDSADAAEVRKDVAKKYPDLVKKGFAERLLPGTETYYSDRMLSVLQGMAPRVFTPEGVAYTKFASTLRDLVKTSGVMGAIGQKLAPFAGEMATHKAELAGLATLAAPSVDEAQAHVRAGLAGDKSPDAVHKRTLLPSAAKPISEIAGLGVLALPSAAHMLGQHA